MKEFERYMRKEYPFIKVNSGNYNHSWQVWDAALKWVLEKSPRGKEDKATFANQGQGLDGYTMLAWYNQMADMIEKELEQ